MCQNEGTLKLLEVGAETAAKFDKQAKGISPSFLLSALDLTNTYALQYKNSLHPHLQVELCLMQLASINEAEKKKTKSYIKPFSGEAALKETPKKENPEPNESASLADRPAEAEPVKVEPVEVESAEVEPIEATEIQLDLSAQGVSGLSLSSLRVQKQHQEKDTEKEDKTAIQSQVVTQELLEQHWNNYAKKMTVSGSRNMVALLGLDIPRLKNKNEIHLIVQNDTNKLELEKNSKALLQYLREHLRNDHISLQVHVDTKEEKKFVYTNKDKYEELRKKNPIIDDFKKSFNLEY
jgi:DNA polymerase-3 subunit gamma/tau